MRPPNKYLKHDYFHRIDTEQKAYWLGFILGDGCLIKDRYEIVIGLKDSDGGHLLKLAKAIGQKNDFLWTENAVRISIGSKQMYLDLLALGLTPAKSLTARWPKIPKKYEHHILRGLFDADGCISTCGKYKQPQFSLVGTKYCLRNAKRILKITNKITSDHSIWTIRKSGRGVVQKIYDMLYKDSTVWLDRKKKRFEELLEC